MNITVLGTGAYGLALAIALSKNSNNKITMWTKIEEEKEIINKFHEYNKVLPNIHIPEEIEIKTDLENAIMNCDLIISAIPVAYTRNVLIELKSYYNDQPICIASKGIEQNTNMLISDIVSNELNTNKIAVLSGASFAIDTVKEYPIGLTLATKDNKIKNLINNAFSNTNINIENSIDLIGTELCGSIKNIIAIGCGILNGLNANESTKAMFITKALKEIEIIIKELNGNEKTLLSYAGIGDLILTCSSDKSRNYKYGEVIATKSFQEIKEYESNTTIEGRYTVKTIHDIIKNNNISNVYIIETIYEITHNNLESKKLFETLFK